MGFCRLNYDFLFPTEFRVFAASVIDGGGAAARGLALLPWVPCRPLNISCSIQNGGAGVAVGCTGSIPPPGV